MFLSSAINVKHKQINLWLPCIALLISECVVVTMSTQLASMSEENLYKLP